MVGRLVGWLVQLDGKLVGWSDGWLVNYISNWMVGRLFGRLVGIVSRLAGELVHLDVWLADGFCSTIFFGLDALWLFQMHVFFPKTRCCPNLFFFSFFQKSFVQNHVYPKIVFSPNRFCQK